MKLTQTDAIHKLLAAGFTSAQAEALADIIWSEKGAGFEPASAMFFEYTLGRFRRHLIGAGLVIGAGAVAAIKLLH